MRNDNLKLYVRLRRELTAEKEAIESKLKQINEALGEVPLPSLSAVQGGTGHTDREAPVLRGVAGHQGNGRRGGRRRMSAAGKARLAEAARKRWAAAKRAGRSRL